MAANADFSRWLRFDSGAAGPYDARAMGNPLRDRRSPQEFAASGQVIEIAEKLADFERLAAIVGQDLDALDAAARPGRWRERAVTGRLGFGFAAAQAGLPVLHGEVSACLDAVCQRCLRHMRMPLEVELQLALVAPGAAPAEAAGLEAWELESELLRPLEIVEEALIMAMPLAAMHTNDGRCDAAAEAVAVGGETTRPFAKLREQMANED